MAPNAAGRWTRPGPGVQVAAVRLVRRHRPRYNIILRDDKHYPYIKVPLNDPFPRLEVVRRIEKDGSAYFGPYPSATSMRRVIGLINRHFLLRKRRTVIDDKPKRPCLNYQIGRCLAPCAHKIDQTSYASIVEEVLQFLRGDYEPLLEALRGKDLDIALQFVNYR